jgi:hypothetical protein
MNRKKTLFRELDEAVAQLVRAASAEGSELVRDRHVRSAVRELERSRKGGQVDLDRVVRAATLLCVAVCDKSLKKK